MEKGVALLNDMEDKKALTSFRKALQSVSDDKEKAALYMYMGIAHFNLLDKDSASQSFQQALLMDPKLALPGSVSPKIREFFEGVKAKLPKKKVEKPKPKTKPKPNLKPKPKPEPEPSGQGIYRITGFTLLGVAVAAAGAGIGMGVWGGSMEDDAGDLSKSYAEASDLHDKASTRYLVANILYGVAGAAAVTSAVMLYFGYRSVPETTVSLIPLPGGGMVQVGGVLW